MTYKEYIGKCPKCSDDVYQRYGKFGLFLKCDNLCGFIFSNKAAISKEDLILLLKGERTKVYTIVKQSENEYSKYNARYKLDMNSYKIKTILVNKKETN